LTEAIDAAIREELDIHLVINNYGTHKTAMVNAGLGAASVVICTSRRPAPVGQTRGSEAISANGICARTTSKVGTDTIQSQCVSTVLAGAAMRVWTDIPADSDQFSLTSPAA
jgi:hypothetical protein